ncbi:MAG: hypothetical protein ACRDNF_15650, partial [Streptosporangiaceae bacterium]
RFPCATPGGPAAAQHPVTGRPPATTPTAASHPAGAPVYVSRVCGALLAGLVLITGTLWTVGPAAASPVAVSRPQIAVPPTAPGGIPPPDLVLSLGSAAGLPMAGHAYQFYVNVTSVSTLAVGINVQMWLTPGLLLTSGAPRGCLQFPGGLDCWYPALPKGQSLSYTLGVAVGAGLAAGTEGGVSALVRYDIIFSKSGSLTRPVGAAPPPPTSPPPHTSPPPTPPPPSSPPPPKHHSAAPAPWPASPTLTPSPSPSPRHKPKPKPKPKPVPSMYHAMPMRAGVPTSVTPKPVIPIGVLLTAILIPCVATAATRFGKHIRH